MNISKLGALIALVSFSSLAQASVIAEALDCNKTTNYQAVKASLDELAKPEITKDSLVYTLAKPFQYGKIQISKFELMHGRFEGIFASETSYKKAFAMIPATNTLKKSKNENRDSHKYWQTWETKKGVSMAEIYDFSIVCAR